MMNDDILFSCDHYIPKPYLPFSGRSGTVYGLIERRPLLSVVVIIRVVGY